MLASRVVNAAALVIGARIFARVIDLAALLVLARLLTPNDFGVVAVAMTLISILEAVLELPVGLVLVRTQEPEPEHYDTAFTLAVLRGAAVGLLVACIAWPYARIFDDARLVPVVLCLGCSPMIRGCVSPRLSDYTRKLQLGPDCCAQLTGKIGGFLAAMAMVAYDRNYWALVAATVTSPVLMVVTSYILAPYRPKFSLKHWRIFRDFLGWLSGTQLLGALSWQCDRLTLGQMSSRSGLGRYTMADTLAMLPIQALAVPANSALFPALGNIQSEQQRLKQGFLMGVNAVHALCLPVIVGLIVLADPICRVVLGPQWGETVPLMQLLAAASGLRLLAYPLSSLFFALGRTKLLMIRTAADLAIKLPLVIGGGLAFGLIGVASARLATECVMFAFSVYLIMKTTGASLPEIVWSLARPVASVAAMALALILLEPKLMVASSPAVAAFSLAAMVMVAAFVYAATILALWTLSSCPAGIEAKVVSVARQGLQRFVSRGKTLFPLRRTAVALQIRSRSNPS